MRPSGKVNLIGVLMLAALAAGVYWFMFIGMLYIDNLEVKEQVQIAYNSFFQSRPEAIRNNLKGALDAMKFGTHDEFDRVSGETKTGLPGLGIKDEQIVIEDDTVRRLIRIAVTYDRVVVLWPTKKIRTVHFLVERKGPYPH